MFEYGYWMLVAINSLVFIVFAFSFTRPKTLRDWRTFNAFSAFIVALFAEMYGFPLTIYLLSGWLGSRYPGLDPFSHGAGHLWYTFLGLSGDPHNMLVHDISEWMIWGGLFFLAITWRFLYKAQREGIVATSGPYRYIRHPQYIAFITILAGFVVQWPTIITLLMFPVLSAMYIRLAKVEEKEALEHFGEEYARYMEVTPAFWPFRLTSRKTNTLEKI